MLRIKNFLFVVLVLVASALAQTAQLKDAVFPSQSLGRTMHYRILLPASYGTSKQSYPVLYLLHGLYGDYKDWSDKTSLTKYVGAADLIIVMPDANDSWYTNWVSDPSQKYEDYIIKDLLAEVESHYRTLNTRDSRWMAGLSMGGYGALKFGLKYPQLFSIVASFSGALTAADNLGSDRPAFAEQLQRTYGPIDNPARIDNDIFELVKFIDPAKLPYLYITCGTADQLLTVNREFVSSLPERKVGYEYHEFPGGHEWTFWDQSIHDFLRDFVPRLQH